MFEPRGYLAIARALAANPTPGAEEAARRAAISRAYYAAVLTVKHRVQRIHGKDVTPGEGFHSAVNRALRRTGSPFMKRIAEDLRELEDHRGVADYDLDPDPAELSDANVDLTLRRADRTIENLGRIADAEMGNLKF